jgi:uncharacterized Zn-finger protein
MNNMTEQESIIQFCLTFLPNDKEILRDWKELKDTVNREVVPFKTDMFCDAFDNRVSNSNEYQVMTDELFKLLSTGSSLNENMLKTQILMKPDTHSLNIMNMDPVAKMNKENKIFVCSFDGCGKSFDYKWILDRHINSHFCFKLYKCEYEGCHKAYKSKENLNLHIKNKHLGEKPYQCRYCISRFSHRNGKNILIN